MTSNVGFDLPQPFLLPTLHDARRLTSSAAIVELSDDDDVQTGAMIALVPSDADIGRLAVDGYEPAAEIHCTLVFLGEADDWDDAQRSAVHVLAEAMAAGVEPFDVTLQAAAEFGRDEKCAVYLVSNGPSDGAGPVEALHEQAMTVPGLPEQWSPYAPHITIGYGLDPDQLAHVGETIRIDRVRVAFAGTHVDYPLAVATPGGIPAAARRNGTEINEGTRGMSSVLVETKRSVWLGAEAWLVRTDAEMAWAEKYSMSNPAYRYMLGRYAPANAANSNGQTLRLEDLQKSHNTLTAAPLNINHERHRVYGSFLASDLVYPTGAATAGLGASPVDTPYMEALSAFYQYLFPDEFRVVEKAASEGALYYSMEAVPQSVTCRAAGCDGEFAWVGPKDPTYCAHLNEKPTAPRWLNKPHFVGGALIVPPVRPGWRQADITNLSSLIRENAELAEIIYDGVAGQLPHLTPAQWEATMFQVLMAAVVDPKRPHNYEADVHGGAHAPCAVCGKPMDDKIHGLPKKEAAAVAGYDDYDDAYCAARDFSSDNRRDLAKKGFAMNDGSFPIATIGDLKNAIRAVGRASNPDAVKAHIKKRAKALGATELLPEDWD